MALVLCQQCLSWVEPIAEQCAQCDYPIDLRTADPTTEELAAAIGPLISRIGPARISRTALPGQGFLYATTGGLFFVPRSVERVRLVSAEQFPRSLRSMFFNMLRTPRRFLRRGVAHGTWGGYRSPMRVEISTHESPLLGTDDGDRLPRLLMDNPGACFFSRKSLRAIRHTFSGWALVRPNNFTLRVRPLGDRANFQKYMASMSDDIREAVCQ
jgi:hypothetical protein